MRDLAKKTNLELRDERNKENTNMWMLLILGLAIAISGAGIASGKFDLLTFAATLIMFIGIFYIYLALKRESILKEIDAERSKRYYEYMEGQTKTKK